MHGRTRTRRSNIDRRTRESLNFLDLRIKLTRFKKKKKINDIKVESKCSIKRMMTSLYVDMFQMFRSFRVIITMETMTMPYRTVDLLKMCAVTPSVISGAFPINGYLRIYGLWFVLLARAFRP